MTTVYILAKIRRHGWQHPNGTRALRAHINVSQDISWASIRFDNKIPCATPRCSIVSIEKRREWLGYELFKVQMCCNDELLSYHFPAVEDTPDPTLKFLAGNAFCLTAYTVFFLGLLSGVTTDELRKLKDAKKQLVLKREQTVELLEETESKEWQFSQSQ